MFKIESYITPILLNYVAKYVKNIRPQDFQVSLWEGEVTFQNLDLRLDVLERELKLPFEFLSGHIHEMVIQVPWTKITSEPIRIFINTIEFVLKAKTTTDDGTKSPANSSDSPQHGEEAAASGTKSKSHDENSPTSTGLAMKIVNNINVQCQNIILKYIEEDIVVSMNVQLLNYSSANDNWKSAVLDINPNHVLMRKLINVSDLTICLDKRNSAGQIDVCQEPLLYRCTLECRILRKCDYHIGGKSSIMRIGIFTQALDLNFSSLQVPMLMRIIKILTSNTSEKPTGSECDPEEDEDLLSSHHPESAASGVKQSYLSWAWNLLPTFSIDDSYKPDTNTDLTPGHTKDFGIYIEELNFTLKNSEFVNDTLMGGIKRIRYTPIVRFTFGGLYWERVVAKEVNWTSMRTGLSSIYVEPLGTFKSEHTLRYAIMETAPVTNSRSFIDKSLFDEKCKIADKGWAVTNYKDYISRFTDEYLMFRSPILAFDVITYRLPKCDAEKSTIYGSTQHRNRSSPTNEDYSKLVNLHKQSRLLSTGVTFRYNQTFLQVKNVIKPFIDSYDSATYSSVNLEKTDTIDTSSSLSNNQKVVMQQQQHTFIDMDNVEGGEGAETYGNSEKMLRNTKLLSADSGSPKLHPPMVEDYDSLMQGIPLCKYKIHLRRFRLEVYPKMEPDLGYTSIPKKLPISIKNTLPFVVVYFDDAAGSLSTPITPDKLVHTTCQLPDKPQELLDNCYNNYDLLIKDCSVNLICPFTDTTIRILTVPKVQSTYGSLLQAYHWKRDEVSTQKLEVQCEQLKLEFSKRELIAITQTIHCSLSYSPKQCMQLADALNQRPCAADTMSMNCNLSKIQLKQRSYHSFGIWNATVAGVQCELIVDRRSVQQQRYNVFASSARILHNNQQKWLEVQVQFPSSKYDKQISGILQKTSPVPTLRNSNGTSKVQFEMALGIWMEKFNLNADKNLLNFFAFVPHENRFTKEYTMDAENANNNIQQQQHNVPPPPPPSSAPSTSMVYQTASSLPQVFSRRSSRHSNPIRKISQPEETIHYSSERDDKVDYNTTEPLVLDAIDNKSSSAVQSSPAQNDSIRIQQYFKQFNSVIIYMELAQSHLNITPQQLPNRIGDNAQLKGEYTQISLPKITLKSSFADYITRSSLRLKVDPPLTTKTTFNWTINFQDLGITTYVNEQAYVVLQPWQTSLTVAMTKKKQAVLPPQSDIDYNNAPAAANIKMPSRINSPKAKHKTKYDRSKREPPAALQQDTLSISSASFEDIFSKESPPPTPPQAPPSSPKPSSKSKYNLETTQSLEKYHDIVCLNLHLDSSTIHLSGNRMNQTQLHVQHLMQIIELMELSTSKQKSKLKRSAKEKVQILNSSEENQFIKEFMDLETNSDISAMPINEKKSLLNKISIFCQWTIAKVIAEIENSQNAVQEHKSKIIMEIEDFLCTVDQGLDFTKYTSKMGNFNLNYLQQNPNKPDWLAPEHLRIRMIAEASDLPFVNLVLTSVNLRDFYKRIGVKRKGDVNRNINEIIITMQAMEIICNLQRIKEFVEPLCSLMHGSGSDAEQQHTTNHNNDKTLRIASQLPLVHFESKGITAYFPLDCEQQIQCTALIWKIDSIQVTPNLQNPLQRKPLRPDVFGKAASMGILSIPGSMIEDRQYELTLKQISAASGNWFDILTHMRNKAQTVHTNPAVEWNNPERKQLLKLNEIFKNFTLIVTYAPNIVFNNILICGQATEVNCSTDFIATLNTDQLKMLSRHAQNIQEIQDSFQCLTTTTISPPRVKNSQCSETTALDLSSEPNPATGHHQKSMTNRIAEQTRRSLLIRSSSQFESIDEDTELLPAALTQKADSGIHSTASSKPISKWQSNSVLLEKLHENPASSTKIEKSFPKTLSFVAGIFLFKIYEIYKESTQTEEEEQIKQRPLLACTISQPSYMFTQNVYESVTHFSIFTLSLALPRATLLDSSVLELAANEFPDIILDTMCGELTSTGIPPSLFTYKIHQTKLKLREIDIEFAKPLLLKLNENYTSALCANLMCIYKSFYCNPVAVQHGLAEIPLHRKSKIMLMKRKTLNADRLNFRFQTFVFSLRDHCNAKDQHSDTCQLVFNDFKINLKYLTRPEKCCVKYSLAALHLKTGEQIFLHPISLKGSLDFLSEPWHSLPLVNAVIKFNVMQIDLSIHVLLQLRKTLENLRKVSQIALLEWQRYQKLNMHDQLQSSIINHNKLRRITCPQAQRFTPNNKSLKREEFYQDDLRAGAFQFVELISDTVLPLPYQIQIIKKDYGIICWRYPQPRKMCKIHIFPVPMAVENPIHIKCRMEYFSEVLECFQHYCDFFLSETISKDIKLPERTSVCATIWRVVILQSLVSVNGECFDTSEEDEELQTIANMNINDILGNTRKDSDFILHPKVLVGCMRVDTIFQSSSVPKVQILLSCNLFKVKFLNEPNDNHELPTSLKQIRLAQVAHTNISHEFLQLNIQNMKIQFTFYNRDIYNINLNTGCNIKVLDYGYLNMIPLMEDMTMQSYLDVNKSKNQLLCNVVCDRLKFNMGPAIIHTLLSSKLYWEECWLGVNNRIPKKHALLSKCVVVNRTESHLAFGQTGTHERLNLKPRECQLYSFRSDYHSQELTFYITDEETNSVESSGSIHIPFKFETEFLIQHMRLGNKCVTIKTRKLSGSQIFILIKGQIELVSMVDHKLRLEFRQEGKQQQQQGAGDESNKTLDNLVENFASISFYHSVQVDDPLTMRLKIADRKIRARTGDIPLRTNKKLPWLVKVPISADGFISFWVRILREDIKELHAHDFKPQKILITIWPIFEMSSMLTCPLIAQEEFNNIQLPGEASRYILDVPATHLTEHKVNFQYPIALTAISKTEYILKLKSLDWHNFFWYDEEQWDIENALKELANPLKTNWPLEDEQELRIQRISHNRNPTDIIYNTKATREFSCALNLEISPWGMFINSTGLRVRISELGNSPKEMLVQENALEMLCNISQGFTIGIQANDAADWIQSLPIYLDHNNSSVKKHKHFYMISTAEPADIVILNGSKVCKFVLHFKIENNRKIFKLLPKIAVVNFSNIQLSLLPFAMDHKESINRNDIKELDVKVEKIPMQCSSTMQNSIGISLCEFYDINSHKAQRSLDSAFLYFVAFKNCDNREDISLPIPLGLAFNRKSLSIQTYDGSAESTIALVVSLIEHNHTYYLTVFEDTTPALLINNQTACPFFIAQTNSSENSKVSSIIGELDGKHLEWYHMIPKQCKSYYTPPQWYLRFPDVDSILCNITLALCDDSSTKKSIKWSKPIRLDKSWNKFLHIPGHGDVKVIICDQHKIIQFNILYISQQMEFSVKDLRSRILTPQQSLEQMPAEEQSSRQLVSSQTTTKSAVTKPDICQHFGSGYESKTDLKIKFFIKELNFSLHTDTAQLQYMKREIISIFADDFLLAYDDSDDYRHMDIVIPNLQIDNQLFSTGKYDFPVILCAQKLYHRMDTLPEAYYLNAYYQELLEKEVMITMKLKLFEDEYKLHSIRCSFSPIRAYIEDAYITDFLDAIVECDPSNCVYRPQEKNERRLLANNEIIIPREVETQGLYMAEPLQLRSFSIESMSVLLSVHTSVRLYIALDHSPLSFSAYERAHLLTMPLKFGQSLGMHYLSGAIFGAGWVVGSLEILGSPSGLARSVTTGLKDFVSMPVRGLFRGPWGFFVGVTQGSASLLKNVTAGTVNSVTKLAASVARNLDRLSLDDEHIERTEALRRSRPSGFTEGFSQGMTGLGISMLGAIGGLAHHTLEAQSPVQVFTGLSKGLVGALTKPISGAAELLALAGQGMLQTVGFNAMPKQRSPSACRNLSSEPLGYRIWKLLPIELSSDQILFYHEITLSVDEQLKRGYALLTSRVFAITEAEWDKLQFALPIDKVRVTQDAVDKTLFYVHLIQEKADLEEDACFTNERIMNFLHTSSIKMTSDALYDLPQTDNNVNNALGYRRQPTLDWSFYINEDLGEHIMRYFKILNSKSLKM